jgi:hypothetical protein
MEATLQSLSQDTLRHLSLKSMVVSAGAARQMSAMIKSCKNLHEMDLSMQRISLDALRALFHGVVQCTSLSRLSVIGGLNVIQAKVLSSCLKGFTILASASSASPSQVHAIIDHALRHDGVSALHFHNPLLNSAGVDEGESHVYRRFGPVGLSLVLEPTAFNDIVAAILYEGIENSTRIVQAEVRSSVSNSHILTVLPRFRRRVQGVLKRNARLVLGAQHQFEEVARVAIYQALQHQPPGKGSGQIVSPTCRVLEFSTTNGAIPLHPYVPTDAMISAHNGGAKSPSIGRRPYSHYQCLPDLDECSSTTPSPHMVCPPEPVQFRQVSALAYHHTYQTDGALVAPPQFHIAEHGKMHPAFLFEENHPPRVNLPDGDDDCAAAHNKHPYASNVAYPVPSFMPPSQQLYPSGPTAPPPISHTATNDGCISTRPFQRHVIVELASLHNMIAQQTKDVEGVRALILQLKDGNDLVLRELAHLLEHRQERHPHSYALHHDQQQQRGPQPQAPAQPPAPFGVSPRVGAKPQYSRPQSVGDSRPQLPRTTSIAGGGLNPRRPTVLPSYARPVNSGRLLRKAHVPAAPLTSRPTVMFPRGG